MFCSNCEKKLATMSISNNVRFRGSEHTVTINFCKECGYERIKRWGLDKTDEDNLLKGILGE